MLLRFLTAASALQANVAVLVLATRLGAEHAYAVYVGLAFGMIATIATTADLWVALAERRRS